jgi:hypothetical protein
MPYDIAMGPNGGLRFVKRPMTTQYVFAYASDLDRAAHAVLATLPDAPIAEWERLSLAAACRASLGTNSVWLTPGQQFNFLSCFEVACESNPDWSDEDYNAVLATLGEGA